MLSSEPSTLTVSRPISSSSHPSNTPLEKQGISSRFLNFFNSLDQKAGAKLVGEDKTVSGKAIEQAQAVIAKTKEVDQNRGVSSRFGDYYNRALGTPVGQR
jgi:hypothetical protein